ncbi:XRE family transcriptional regulator [Kribbella sp. NPDC048915]|uniref:helix-turn-helix domain-containing protein n=1 Tax=Kribbella sp. NPDC048915 TaxID=3155148 RepID=UPI0033E383D0
MTVIDEWTGRHAHALRTALRLTNEAFADQLGISPRTLTKWKERPELVPSPALQEALDGYLKQAPPDAHVRFAANLGLDQPSGPLDNAALAELSTALGDLTRALARLQAPTPERSPTS